MKRSIDKWLQLTCLWKLNISKGGSESVKKIDPKWESELCSQWEIKLKYCHGNKLYLRLQSYGWTELVRMAIATETIPFLELTYHFFAMKTPWSIKSMDQVRIEHKSSKDRKKWRMDFTHFTNKVLPPLISSTRISFALLLSTIGPAFDTVITVANKKVAKNFMLSFFFLKVTWFKCFIYFILFWKCLDSRLLHA